MSLARGFKAYCERVVGAVRGELCLNEHEPIDMHVLAIHLDIPVWSLAQFLDSSGESRLNGQVDEIYRKVSAMTIFDGPRRAIVFNEEHSPHRHRSNMAHELAHALLQHPPSSYGIDPQQEKLHEEEAAHLGGVLMLSAMQARQIVVQRLSANDASERFHVSPEMLRYRLNVTGAMRLAQR